MGDPTRIDNGANQKKLAVTIEMDLSTSLVTVETNVADSAVLLRLIGQGMHIWADNQMKVKAEAMQKYSKRPFALPKQGGN